MNRRKIHLLLFVFLCLIWLTAPPALRAQEVGTASSCRPSYYTCVAGCKATANVCMDRCGGTAVCYVTCLQAANVCANGCRRAFC
jgi:hypothetical protein